LPLLDEYLHLDFAMRQASGKGLLVNRKLGGYREPPTDFSPGLQTYLAVNFEL
jgi:hypothetical protein